MNSVPPIIYHYTDGPGLMGILSTNELWATHIRHLNDSAELEYGFELAKSEITKRLDIAKQNNDPDQIILCQDLLDVICERLAKDSGLKAVDGDTPYVVSFCSDDDNLGMWRGYARGDGYAIGFSTEELVQPDYQNSLDQNGDLGTNFGLTAMLSAVTYGDIKIAELITSILQAHATNGYQQFVTKEATLFGGIKHPAYEDEREVRLIVSPDGCMDAPRYLRPGQKHLIPYMRFAFPEEAIVSLKVGPGPYQERNWDALRIFLDQGGRGPVEYYDSIQKSTIPYIP